MYLPKIKFKKNVTFEKDIFLRIAKSIKTNQLDSGAITSNADLSHDPWDHIEAIMGLNFLKDKESSDLAFKWLKNNQNKDGSWYAKYSNNDPIELNKPTHFGSYISVVGLAVFLLNLLYAFAKKRKAQQNPWGEGATTLEWTVSSPPPFHTFEELPKVK